VPSFTLFFVPEGLAFIDYITAQPAADLVHAVARFERAMWHARFEPRGPRTVIEFAAPPDLVLAAALQCQPLPPPSDEPHFVVVSPGVAGRWRIATADEVAALDAASPAQGATWPPSP
jgi:hypothetical protein